MKDKKIYILLVVSILITVIGVSLAFFALNIVGNENAKNVVIITGDLKLLLTDGNAVSLSDAKPGDSVTKTITVKNTGTKEISYNLVWQDLVNGITNNELIVDGTCKNLNASNTEDGTCSAISKKAVKEGNITSNIPIKPGYTHEYVVRVTFKDTGTLQNYNLNKSFTGKIGITESSAKTIYCTFDGELTQGAEYVNGQYTYRYMQEGNIDNDDDGNDVYTWSNINTEGWGVILTDKTSIVAVTSELCTYINNKPVISMQNMFYNSKASNINLENFNTSNVINMRDMFDSVKAASIDLSSFNTSNVTNMNGMFCNSRFKNLNLSSFNTSKVTSMSGMFSKSFALSIDLNSFDTSNVTNMGSMFANSKAITLDLSSFDTSKVTSMYIMFFANKAEIIDLSSFDTSNVKEMMWMFRGDDNLKTIYASDKFVVDNVISSKNMFLDCPKLVGGEGKTVYAYADKTYARIDKGTNSPGYFTDIADKPVEPYSFSSDSWATIAEAVKNNNISKYKVGDTKLVALGTYGSHMVRIANTSTPNECSGTGFSQTACGFVIEFADVITYHKMNETNTTTGGWPASSMRTFVNNDIYNAMPYSLKNIIIDTTVVSGHGSGDTDNLTSTDKLYLLASKEIFTDWAESDDTVNDLTRKLDYYTNIGVTTTSYSGAIKKNGTNATVWWLRSARSSGNSVFNNIMANGYWKIGEPANSNSGVSPAFRIG